MNDWLIYAAAGATLLAIVLTRRASRPRSDAPRRDTPQEGAGHTLNEGALLPGLSGGPAVDGHRLLCTCEEWRTQRARFKPEDPRRCCVHLCAALGKSLDMLPSTLLPFAPLIALMREQEQGVPFAPPTFAFVLGKAGYLVTMPAEARPWAMVYAGRTPYAFNIQSGEWGDSGTPPFADDLGKLIRGELRRRTAKSAPSTRS